MITSLHILINIIKNNKTFKSSQVRYGCCKYISLKLNAKHICKYDKILHRCRHFYSIFIFSDKLRSFLYFILFWFLFWNKISCIMDKIVLIAFNNIINIRNCAVKLYIKSFSFHWLFNLWNNFHQFNSCIFFYYKLLEMVEPCKNL